MPVFTLWLTVSQDDPLTQQTYITHQKDDQHAIFNLYIAILEVTTIITLPLDIF